MHLGWKSRGRGNSDFCQNAWGCRGFPDKIALRFSYFGFYCIFITKSFEICLGGPMFPPSPLCMNLWWFGCRIDSTYKNSSNFVNCFKISLGMTRCVLSSVLTQLKKNLVVSTSTKLRFRLITTYRAKHYWQCWVRSSFQWLCCCTFLRRFRCLSFAGRDSLWLNASPRHWFWFRETESSVLELTQDSTFSSVL